MSEKSDRKPGSGLGKRVTSRSAIFDQLKVAERVASGLHESVRSELEARLRALGCVEPKDLSEGQAISHRINALLNKVGLRFKFPDSERPATLGYLASLRSKPGEFFLRASSREAVSLHGDFSSVELVAAPPRKARSSKKARPKKRG
jgi:hypothetical protein